MKIGTYRFKDRNHWIMSINAEEACDKVQDPFMTQVLNKLGTERKFITLERLHAANLWPKAY